MKKVLFILSLVLTVSLHTSVGQSINFIESVSIDNALSLAQQSGKNVFIDTYASWCIPCKKMEIEFRNKEVSSFFNQNYINVKIDMDNSIHAKEYRKRFDIVFLPTMIILDQEGKVKYKTDKVMPGRALKGIAKKAMQPEIYFESEASRVMSSPVVKKGTPKGDSPNQNNKDRERIVHIAGSESSDHSPEYYYKEAYFRIELMDGSHRASAQKYLSTQEDWSSPKNMRFIYDFLYSTQSPEFAYFEENIEAFRKELGDLNVNITLDVLIHDRLHNGFPRPDFEEVLRLYSLKDDTYAEQLTYQYFLPRLINECNYTAYNEYASAYLQKFQLEDPNILYTMAEYCLVEGDLSKKDLKFCIDKVESALELNKNKPLYYESLTRLYMKAGNKKKARKAATEGIKASKAMDTQSQTFEHLMAQINKN